MKAFRKLHVRLTSAAALAAAFTIVPVGGALADPSDAVCIMPPEDYCQYIEGHIFGTSSYRECARRAAALQIGEYCNPIDWSSAPPKLD